MKKTKKGFFLFRQFPNKNKLPKLLELKIRGRERRALPCVAGNFVLRREAATVNQGGGSLGETGVGGKEGIHFPPRLSYPILSYRS